jgi:transposase
LALWYRARTADSRIGTRKTMIVALARKLVIALWRFVTTGEPPNPGLGSPGFLDRTLNLGG